jgi:hypothetical protein
VEYVQNQEKCGFLGKVTTGLPEAGSGNSIQSTLRAQPGYPSTGKRAGTELTIYVDEIDKFHGKAFHGGR